MHLRKSVSQSLKKSVRKVKTALQMKKTKNNEVGSINEKKENRDIIDTTHSSALHDSNRIESWWKKEEERIMRELRNIGRTDPLMILSS